MDSEPLKANLRTVITGLVTPFRADGGIDHDSLAENARALSDRGIQTFFACGNISEYHALTHAERIEITETSVDALPEDATVLAGIGGSIGTAIDLGQAAVDRGVDGLMVMPPDHTFKHERGLLEYYRRIGDGVDVPIVPYLRQFAPSAECIAAISELDTVVGIKYAIDDIPKFAEATSRGAENIVWINGLGERHAVALYAEGARGMASGIGNFEPAIGIALFEALEAGDWARAREIRDRAQPYMCFREQMGQNNTFPGGWSIQAVKAGLEFFGLTGGTVRPPLVELPAEARNEADQLLEEMQTYIETEL